MKWSLLFFTLPCLPVSAATVSVPLGSTLGGTNTATSLFTADITNRTGLTLGLPILVSFDVPPLFGGFQLRLPGTGTFRDTFTITAVLGSQTASTSATIVLANPPLVFSWPASMTFAPFSLTVPWETDLTILSITVLQEARIEGDPGNSISIAGGGSTMTITTQSVPEPSACLLAASAFLLAAGRKRESAA
jgi:hypothetical protein